MEENKREHTLNLPQSLDITKIGVQEIPDDIIFPDELNRYLREQIRYYTHENGMLQKNLADIELVYKNSKTKVAELEAKLKSYENENILNSSQVASLKIVELSKKLREKNSEVEVLKTKNSKLEKTIYEFNEKSEDCSRYEEIQEKPANELEEKIKKLEEKLSHTTIKLTEARNSNLQLKNDLKLANKWLQQEIGENFESLQQLSNSSNGWRGRAQIIIDLQQKNNELKDKLKIIHDKEGCNSTDFTLSKGESKISILSKENSDLKVQYEELKKKYEALKARCRVLDTDCILLKSKYAMMKEQSDRDQEIITTLSAQITSTKELKNDILKERDGMINRIIKEKDSLLKQIEEYKSMVKKIKEELEQKNTEIENYKSLQSCHKCGNQYENMAKLSRLEAEIQRLLKFTEHQNERLIAERDAHSKTQALLRLEKQKVAKAEATAARMELDTYTSRSSYSTCSSSTRALDFTLKDQLELAEENIKALKTRLEIEQYERKMDLQEFAKVLQSCDNEIDSTDP